MPYGLINQDNKLGDAPKPNDDGIATIIRTVLSVITVFTVSLMALALLSYSGVDIPYITRAIDVISENYADKGVNANSGSDPGSGAGSDFGAGTDAGASVRRTAGSDSGSGADTESGSMSSSGADTESGLMSASGADTELGSMSGSGPGADEAVAAVNMAALYKTAKMLETYEYGPVYEKQVAAPAAGYISSPSFSLSYDPGEETVFCIYGEYVAECSRDSFNLLNKDGAETFKKNIRFTKPSLRKRGDYLLVSDLGGRTAFVMKGSKLVWEGTFTSVIANASVNNSGYIAFVLEAAGYRNSVRAMAPIGRALFDWIVADDYVIASEIAPSGKNMVINRMNTSGISVSSSLEFLDMQSEPYLTVDSGEDEIFLSVRFLNNNTLAVASEDTFRLFSEQGAPLIQDAFGQISALCEFPPGGAAVAVWQGDRSYIVGYDARALKAGVLYASAKPVVDMSADNGCLFVNFGAEAVVIKENGKISSHLAFESEVLYGGASAKAGALAVTANSADIYMH